MATPDYTYYVDTLYGVLYASISGPPSNLPKLFIGSHFSFRLYPCKLLVQPINDVILAQYDDISAIDLQLEVGVSGASAVMKSSIGAVSSSEVNKFSKGDKYFDGILDLTTTDLGQDEVDNLKFEIQLFDGTSWKTCYQQLVNIYGVVRNVSGTALPTTVDDLQKKFDQRYVKWDGNQNGATITLPSPDGTHTVGLACANNGSFDVIKS